MVLMMLLFSWEITLDKRKDPVPQRVSQVVGQAFQENKVLSKKSNASLKAFLRQEEKHYLMNSLPPSQVFLCNEIVTVILIDDL